MRHVRLGHTGLHVSEICLGTMTFGNQADEATSHAILDTAINHGVTFIDTADVYPLGGDLTSVGRTEEIIGTWMQARQNRHDIVLATKRTQTFSPEAFTQLGVDLSRKKIVVVKSSNHFHAAFSKIAAAIHYLDTGGPLPPRPPPGPKNPRPPPRRGRPARRTGTERRSPRP